jgi:hypothetical protein
VFWSAPLGATTGSFRPLGFILPQMWGVIQWFY